MEMTLNQKVEHAEQIIRENIIKYPLHAFSYSGGKDSDVLLHIARKAIGYAPQAFAVLADTEFEVTEWHVQSRQNINLKVFRYTNPKDPADCCRSKKVEKFKEATAKLDCWFSGIRADEGITRANFKEIEERDGLVKINPILGFTETDVWRYLAINGVPVNPAYRDGYRSLSCSRCSVPETSTDEAERAGRWKGTKNEGCECGIHTKSLRA